MSFIINKAKFDGIVSTLYLSRTMLITSPVVMRLVAQMLQELPCGGVKLLVSRKYQCPLMLQRRFSLLLSIFLPGRLLRPVLPPDFPPSVDAFLVAIGVELLFSVI